MNKKVKKSFLFKTLSLSLIGTIATGATSPVQAQERSATPAEILELAATQDPSLQAAMLERQRSSLLIETEENRFVPIFSGEAGYRAGQTAQPGPTGIQFITTQTLSSNAAFQYTLPVGTQLGAAIRFERAVQDSVVLGNLGTVWGTNLSLDVAQPLLRGFGKDVGQSGLRDAMYAHDIAKLEEISQANTVASEVLTAYWRLWFLEGQQEVVRDTLALQNESLALAKVREELGVVARGDIARLEAEVAQATEEVLSVQGSINAQRLELSRLVGALDDPPEWSTRGITPSFDQVPDDEQVVLDALAKSPDVRRLAQLVLRTRLQSFLADNQAKPDLQTVATLSVNGIGFNAGQALVQLARFDSVVGYVGVRVSLPVIRDGLEATAERAELGVERAQKDLENAQNRLRTQALARHADILLARERITLAKVSVDAAKRSTEIEQARYEAGDGTSFEVTQAIARQRQSELRVLSAQLDERLSSIELRRLTGTLLQTEAP